MSTIPSQRTRRVPFLIGGAGITMSMQVRMLNSLFGQQRITIAGAILALVVGSVAWHVLHWVWLWFWVGAVIATAIIRYRMGISYVRRPDNSALGTWAVRFAATAWAVGGLWGVVIFGVVGFGNNDGLKIIAIIAASGVVAGGSTRNHASPAGVLGQILLIEVPTIIGLLVGGTAIVDWVISGFSVLNTMVTWSTASHLMAQTINILQTEARNAELLIELNEANQSLIASNVALETTSLTDELTGVANRRGMLTALDRIWRQGARMAAPVGAIMIDIDHFKAFNDRYGHIEGDHCLRIVAATLAGSLSRADDLCARYGGEEFVIILPGTDQNGCIHVAETLRAAIETRRIAHIATTLGHVTISLGVTSIIPVRDQQSVDLIATADQALYRAKTLGRNRSEFADAADRAVAVE